MPIDYKKYPPNWLSEIRPRIMKRANNKCEFCGLEHGQIVHATKFEIKEDGRYKLRTLWFTSYSDAVRSDSGMKINDVKVVLTIAHLDHDETNFEVKDERLKALCQMCHLRYDSREKYRRACSREDFIKYK